MMAENDREYAERMHSRKGLVEMMAVNMHSGDHHIDLSMEQAATLAAGLVPLVERIIAARVRQARREKEGGHTA